MSKDALYGLRDYLVGTLSPGNMLWLATQLTECAEKADAHIKRYTMDDINDIIDDAEREIAAGEGMVSEDLWREMEERMTREEAGYIVSAI